MAVHPYARIVDVVVGVSADVVAAVDYEDPEPQAARDPLGHDGPGESGANHQHVVAAHGCIIAGRALNALALGIDRDGLT